MGAGCYPSKVAQSSMAAGGLLADLAGWQPAWRTWRTLRTAMVNLEDLAEWICGPGGLGGLRVLVLADCDGLWPNP
eukprot:gene16577-biopygen7596